MKTIKLLKKYRIENYSIDKNGKVTINGSLDLSSLRSIDKDFLKDTIINGSLYLGSLQSADKDFLKDTVINGSLYLGSLRSADKDFLKDTVINGSLYLGSLQSADKESLIKNVKKLKKGYNEKGKYCFFDNVISVSKKRGCFIYRTPMGYVVKKNRYTAYGETIKKAIQDVEFKIISEKLKKSPIEKETELKSILIGSLIVALIIFILSVRLIIEICRGNVVV